MSFDPIAHRIFETVYGSRLYGTATIDSDMDLRGCCLPTMDVLLNPFMSFEQKDSGFEEEDRVIYALGQFFKLCADCNPSIVEMLFAPKRFWVYTSWHWEEVVRNRELFLSKNARYRYAGYAVSQFYKVKRHRRYFTAPIDHKPTRKEFGLSDIPVISGDGLNAVMNVSYDLLHPNFVEEIRKEREYRDAMKEWKDFVSWRDGRNPARKKTEEKFGFDCKGSSHILRLMHEGKELLLEGNITFPLPKADDILAVKNGEYTYEQIEEIVKDLDRNFDLWYNESPLPKSPDRNKLTELYFKILGV
jgi:predicted nucleotidyltransferase